MPSTRLPTSSHSQEQTIAIICPVYPSDGSSYGGQYIQVRARAYQEAGFAVTVLEVDAHKRADQTHRSENDGITLYRTSLQGAADALYTLNPDRVFAHQVQPWTWVLLKPWSDRLAVWIHGAEARSWRELESSYTPKERRRLRPFLDHLDRERRTMLREMLSVEDLPMIAPSQFMADTVRTFAGSTDAGIQIIPNPILGENFPYREKSTQHAKRILWVRNFANFNYANDLARDAVLALSKRDDFADLHITIRGDGKLFEDIVSPLRVFPNIDIRRGFLDQNAMSDLHSHHGVMLVPSRWESHGLTAGEAMRSGLVPVTTRIAALPEFMTNECACLCEPENPQALADAMGRLMDDPSQFQEMSARASKMAVKLCGRDATITRDLAIGRLRHNN